MNNYEYRSLDPEAHQIRLLQIQKSSDESLPITVSLRHVSLDDEQHFNALSYTWGDETPTTQIAIHDGETLGFVSARRNLLEFLKEARQSTGEWSSEWIWIDQISINQDDQNERGHQVSQMGKLYSIAQMTLVWPWSWPESSVEPEQTTPATSQLDMNKLLCDDAHLTAVWKRSKKPEFPLLLLRHLTFGLYVRLREAPYWKRLWIIQEIVLARQCFIMISGKLWDLKHFIRLATWLIYLRRRDEDEEGVTFLWNLMNIVDLRTSRRKSLDRKILRVLGSSIPYGWDKALLMSSEKHYTVPLDRVYGVMGLLHKDLHIQPDYEITERELLRQILYMQITKFSSLRFNRWRRVYRVLQKWQDIGFQLPQDSQWDMDIKLNDLYSRRRMKRVVLLALDELDLPTPPFTYIEAGEYIYHCWNIPPAVVKLAGAHIRAKLSSHK